MPFFLHFVGAAPGMAHLGSGVPGLLQGRLSPTRMRWDGWNGTKCPLLRQGSLWVPSLGDSVPWVTLSRVPSAGGRMQACAGG